MSFGILFGVVLIAVGVAILLIGIITRPAIRPVTAATKG